MRLGDCQVRVGIAGWDYADWNGTVYPARARRGFDRLAFVAAFVELIEVNVSFYRVLPPSIAASWVERTPPGLRFSAKLHRSCTHEPDADPARSAGPTLDGLQPLREHGRLAALLAQFPQSFHRNARALDRLDRIRDAAEGWPLVVEVRHRSWGDEESRRWFAERSLGWCVVDQPRVGRSTLGFDPYVAGEPGYMRLHGRNAQNWFREGAGRDGRYDYLYALDELRPIADSIRTMAGQARELVVVQNNHFRGQALANALQLRHLLGERSLAAPQELAETYPELAPIATVRRDRLF